jgi:hypothetical protein
MVTKIMDHLTANQICPAASVFQVLVIRLLLSEGPTNGLQEANIVSVRLSTVPKEDGSNYLWVRAGCEPNDGEASRFGPER